MDDVYIITLLRNMVFAQTKLLSRYGLHFPKGSLNGITPPIYFGIGIG